VSDCASTRWRAPTPTRTARASSAGKSRVPRAARAASKAARGEGGCAPPASAPHEHGGPGERRRRGRERPERPAARLRARRLRLRGRARLRGAFLCDDVERQRLASRHREHAPLRIEVGDLDRRQLEPPCARGHQRVAEGAARGGAARVLADREARRIGEELDVGADQRVERGRGRVPHVGLARELKRERERLAEPHLVARGGEVQLELADQDVGGHALGQRLHPQRGARHRHVALAAVLAGGEHQLRARDRDCPRAGRKERAAELRSVQAVRRVGERARRQPLGPEPVERRRLPARARVDRVGDLDRKQHLLVDSRGIAIERDAHGDGVRIVGARRARERERRGQREPARHHVGPPGRARVLPPLAFVTCWRSASATGSSSVSSQRCASRSSSEPFCGFGSVR